MNATEGLKAIETYFDLMSINGGSHIFRTAKEFGVFDVLWKKTLAPSEIADKCGMQEKGAKLLLECLCGLEVVVFEHGCYGLAPVMGFLAGAYGNLSDEYWHQLPEFLKSGTPMAKMDTVEQSEEQYVKQVLALSWMLKPSAVAAGQMLGIGKQRKGLNILDVGAGSAVWSLALAQADETSEVTALDWPKVLQIAEGQAKQCSMLDRFHKLPGNYHDTDLADETYDLAIVGNVTHIETPDGNTSLMKKVYKSLKTNGEIVIFDILSGQGKGNLSASLYAMGLALRTEQGQVYHPDELKGFLESAGFTNFKATPIPATPYTMGMFTASK
jgi:ubiquinone/menaquinone biosynthesis C-methylase UbiE